MIGLIRFIYNANFISLSLSLGECAIGFDRTCSCAKHTSGTSHHTRLSTIYVFQLLVLQVFEVLNWLNFEISSSQVDRLPSYLVSWNLWLRQSCLSGTIDRAHTLLSLDHRHRRKMKWIWKLVCFGGWLTISSFFLFSVKLDTLLVESNQTFPPFSLSLSLSLSSPLWCQHIEESYWEIKTSLERCPPSDARLLPNWCDCDLINLFINSASLQFCHLACV